MHRAKAPSRQLNIEAIRGATLDRAALPVQNASGMSKKGTSEDPGIPYARSRIFARKPFQVCFLKALAKDNSLSKLNGRKKSFVIFPQL